MAECNFTLTVENCIMSLIILILRLNIQEYVTFLSNCQLLNLCNTGNVILTIDISGIIEKFNVHVTLAKVRSIYWGKFAQGPIQTLPTWDTTYTIYS